MCIPHVAHCWPICTVCWRTVDAVGRSCLTWVAGSTNRDTSGGLEMGETVTARRQDAADRHQPPVLAGIDHVEWWVGNARAFSAFLASAFGFEFVAYAGPETGRRDRVSYVL